MALVTIWYAYFKLSNASVLPQSKLPAKTDDICIWNKWPLFNLYLGQTVEYTFEYTNVLSDGQSSSWVWY